MTDREYYKCMFSPKIPRKLKKIFRKEQYKRFYEWAAPLVTKMIEDEQN